MNNPSIDAVLDQVDAALAKGESARAFELVAPLYAQVEHDVRLANVWLTLLRIAPKREHLKTDVERIVASWPDDNALQLLACDALIRAAELDGPDVPAGSDSAAARAVSLAETNLEKLAFEQRKQAAVGGYWLMNHANALRLCHRYADAAASYTEALDLDANNGDWWFNFGLLHKARGDFDGGLQAAQKACELVGERRGILWNIAICATALGKGVIAVEAMHKLGFKNARVLDNGMPHVDDLPPAQVRVATRGSGHGFGGAELEQGVVFELLWVTPASPCHGVVSTPTFREASVDYGDLVLWDGTPIGVVEHEGKPVPRFPLLSRLRAGDERRIRFIALEQDDGDVAACARDLPEPGQLFLQRARVEMLCPTCASGGVADGQQHTHGTPEPHRLVYGKLVVPGDVELKTFRADLDAYLKPHRKVQFILPGLHEALGETKLAGKAHQLWRGLERSAQGSDVS